MKIQIRDIPVGAKVKFLRYERFPIIGTLVGYYSDLAIIKVPEWGATGEGHNGLPPSDVCTLNEFGEVIPWEGSPHGDCWFKCLDDVKNLGVV